MADRRRVSVHLELEIARTVGPAAQAATVIRRLGATIDDLGDEADGAGRDMVSLAGNTDIAALAVDDLGDEARMTTAELMLLERQMHSTSRAARGMDMTPSVSGVARAGGGAARAAGSGGLDLGNAGLRPRNLAIAGIVEAVALAAPTIGAMISGAIVGAVGVGGIAGGIVAASNSPAVKLAATNFAGNISAAFTQYGDQFVEPLVRSFDILEQGFHDLNLERAFEKVAAYVDDIARGLAGFGRNMMPGIMVALDKAGPILEVLGRELPRLGTAFGEMFATIASGSGVVEGFYFLMGSIKFTFEAVGATLKFLTDAFHEWIGFVASLSGALEDTTLGPFSDQMANLNDITEDFINKANVGGQAMNYVGREMQTTAQSAEAMSYAIGVLNEKLYEQHSAQLALSDAHLAYKADLLRIKEGVKEHGNSLKMSTDQGIANRQMINQLIGGLRQEYEQALVAAGGNEQKQERARRAYNKQIADLQGVLNNLGFEKREIEKIIGAYKNIPSRVYTKIIQDYETRGVPAGEHSGPRIEHRAAGGPVSAGVLYEVNEVGREFFRPAISGSVVPLAAMSSSGSASSGTHNYTINTYVAPGGNPRDVGGAIVGSIQAFERANGDGWRR